MFLIVFLSNLNFSAAQIRRISGGQQIVSGSSIQAGMYRNKSLNNVKPIGSPYLSENFKDATIENIDSLVKMRFNIYKNEFEFISSTNDTLILDKIEAYKNIKFIENNRVFKLVKFPNSKNELEIGYLHEMHRSGIFTLFKKENIRFKEEKIGITSFEGNMPSRFYTIKSSFFLKVRSVIINFPENKKGILKLFPNKKEPIESFLKENKIDFDNENDLMKLVDFIGSF